MARTKVMIKAVLLAVVILLQETDSSLGCSSSCPPSCDCSSRDLHSIPQDLPLNITTLNLEGNQISSLNQSDLQRYNGLVRLDLSNNSIRTIPGQVFANLTNLRWLHLQINNIDTISPDAFANLPQLQILRLDNNRISTIPQGTFTNLQRLQQLYIYRNQIRTIPPNVFANLPQLNIIYAQYNQINSFSFIAFANIPKLQSLHLYNNKISSIANLPAPTRELFLQSNLLKTLPAADFHKLVSVGSVDISNNPWLCDCRINGFRIEMTGSSFEDQIICDQPARYKGQKLKDLNVEDLVCEPDSTNSSSHINLYAAIFGTVGAVINLTVAILGIWTCWKKRKGTSHDVNNGSKADCLPFPCSFGCLELSPNDNPSEWHDNVRVPHPDCPV